MYKKLVLWASGNEGNKALLVSERDISQGKYRLLFSAPEAIVDSRKLMLAASLHTHVRILLSRTFSALDDVISRSIRKILEKIIRACACSSPQTFLSPERPGNVAKLRSHHQITGGVRTQSLG